MLQLQLLPTLPTLLQNYLRDSQFNLRHLLDSPLPNLQEAVLIHQIDSTIPTSLLLFYLQEKELERFPQVFLLLVLEMVPLSTIKPTSQERSKFKLDLHFLLE